MKNKSNDLRHTIMTQDKDGNSIEIKIRLNDECNNGHQDFSITGTVWEKGKPKTDRNMITGGAIGDYVAAHFPELEIFNRLHLCDYSGVPMYAIENGFYHLKNGFNNTKPNAPTFENEFCYYYRVTPEQFKVLATSETETRFAVHILNLGILQQWKEEANKAIKMLEEWTGDTFLIDSRKTQFNAPTAEAIQQENEREASGYYTVEQIQERETKRIADARAKQYQTIEAERDKETGKAQREYEVKKAVLDGGLPLDNFILYTHTNEGTFNWYENAQLVSDEDFARFASSVKVDGITWRNSRKGK